MKINKEKKIEVSFEMCDRIFDEIAADCLENETDLQPLARLAKTLSIVSAGQHFCEKLFGESDE